MRFYQDILWIQQEHWLLFFVVVFFFSLCVGSFLNVVIYRLPEMMKKDWYLQARLIIAGHGLEGESLEQAQQKILDKEEAKPAFNLAVPASTCPQCGHKIKPWENIPVISWLLLRAKCSACQSPISMRYPSIELAAAILGVLVYGQFGLSPQALSLLGLTYVLVALFWIDVDHQLLPDSLTLPLLWVGLLLNLNGTFVALEEAVIGAMVGYLSLWSIFWLFKLVTGKEGMGFGDFKLMAAVGAWFGWQILPQVILWSAIVGAVIGVALIVLRGRDKQQPMPYGPFIAVAAWLLAVYGEQLSPLLL